ncbi:PfkB family carbohydrate kinase [Clostridium sp.]|uniref:PfkB family carbohydrate kinase n=1 Tax=Clostridium sp. TaxID=1506 RepID=UPI00397753E3
MLSYPTLITVVNTTAAGDTFTRYFLAGVTRGLSVPQSLELASKASAIAVTRHGAAPSIPVTVINSNRYTFYFCRYFFYGGFVGVPFRF